jgi:ELWxxDGT repeat protein
MAAVRSLCRPSLLCVLLLACLAAGASAQPAFRVVDLNTTPTPLADQFFPDQGFKALGSTLFVVADDGIHGFELWRSDGTAAGTRLVKDICPGACDSRPLKLTVSNGLLFFVASDGAHGRELWRTDGTEAGTTMVMDLYPGLQGFVDSLMDADGTLFFVAADVTHGSELWKTDGTAAGTQLVKDIGIGTFGIARLLAASGGLVLLGASDGFQGLEPWVSDGTEAGTVMLGDLNPGFGDSIGFFPPSPVSLLGWDAAAAPWGGFLFSADDGSNGMSLWSTDGTPDGTHRIKTLGDPHGLTAFNGAVYFAATDPASGTELWKTDGTPAGTALFKDLQPGAGSSDPVEITVAGNRLFFRATDDTHGSELVTSDGTPAGTVLMDLNPGLNYTFYPYDSSHQFYYGLSAFGNDLIFLGFTPGGGPISLWRSNGTLAGTVPLTNQGFLDYQMPGTAAVAGGRFYFRSDPGPELWTSDGTGAGTHSVKNLSTADSAFRMDGGKISPGGFGALGNLLFFGATDGSSGYEPWKSDGTPGGTSQVASLGSPAVGSFPLAFTPLGGREIFQTWIPSAIWASDGTPGGTQRLSDPSVTLQDFVTAGGSAFFRAFDSSFHHVWRTDGTPAGTLKLAEFPQPIQAVAAAAGKVFIATVDDLWVSDGVTPGVSRLTVPLTGDSFFEPNGMTEVAGLLFFFNLESKGWALWKSDGTEAETSRVADIGALGNLFAAPAGGPLFFLVEDPLNGLELWKSDGTGAGTGIVKDIFPGSRSSEITGLTVAGNRVYFVADDNVHGRELWVSDGTDAGTHLVQDLLPGPGSSLPDSLAAVGNVLLFSATDGVYGVEPWRTDGTAVGTRRIQDLAPAQLSSSPTEFTAAGSNVYFAANDNTTGFELWAAPKTNVLAIFGDVPTDYFAWRFVESLVVNGVTSGCGPGQFCPGSLVTRAEAAVFLLAARGTPPPPATGTVFADVPPGFWAGPWIEQLAAEGIVGGCATNPPRYCPGNTLTRAEMAILLLGARHVTPPPATGTVFSDVPASYWAARWIEQLAAEGISNGCGGGRFCPDQPITRAEMAVFLVANFHLPCPEGFSDEKGGAGSRRRPRELRRGGTSVAEGGGGEGGGSEAEHPVRGLAGDRRRRDVAPVDRADPLLQTGHRGDRAAARVDPLRGPTGEVGESRGLDLDRRVVRQVGHRELVAGVARQHHAELGRLRQAG